MYSWSLHCSHCNGVHIVIVHIACTHFNGVQIDCSHWLNTLHTLIVHIAHIDRTHCTHESVNLLVWNLHKRRAARGPWAATWFKRGVAKHSHQKLQITKAPTRKAQKNQMQPDFIEGFQRKHSPWVAPWSFYMKIVLIIIDPQRLSVRIWTPFKVRSTHFVWLNSHHILCPLGPMKEFLKHCQRHNGPRNWLRDLD